MLQTHNAQQRLLDRSNARGEETVSYLWLTAVISAFYVFDSAMLPFAGQVVHMKFLILTGLYLFSVAELNGIYFLVRKWTRKSRSRPA